MVARRSPSESAGSSNEASLRKALAESEAEVEELRVEINKIKSTCERFLSDASHAVRNPLTITHSYLEILNSDLGEGLTEEQQSFLEVALENAVRLRELVEELVDLAALETGVSQIDCALTPVHQIIESVCAELQPIADREGLKLTVEEANDLPKIFVDESRAIDSLRRVVANSIFFTQGGGSIHLSARQNLKHVEIEVCDTGAGIPNDRVDDAWRPFSQLHRKPGEHRRGFGLGLPLCQRQMEAMGGAIALESIEGEGTTVTLRFPVAVTSNQ